MTSHIMSRILRAVLALTIFGLGIAYAAWSGAELAVLAQIRVLDFLAVIAGMFATFVATSFTFFLIVEALKVRLRTREWIGLTFIANALNYLGPIRPGVLVKAAYLKQRVALRYSHFSSALAAKAVLFVATTSSLALVAIAWMQPEAGEFRLVAGICVGITALSVLPLVMPAFRLPDRGWVFESLNAALAGFEVIRSQRGRTAWISLSIVLQHLLSALVAVMAFDALGFEINYAISLALVCLASLSNILALTPNNLGVQEVVVASVYMAAGLDFSEGILGATLIRAAHISVTFAGAPLFAYALSSRSRVPILEALDDDRELLPRQPSDPEAP